MCTNKTFCSECESNYYYDPVNGKCGESGSCPIGYYEDTENIKCVKC